MKNASLSYSFALNAPASEFWPALRSRPGNFRPVLNLQELEKLIRIKRGDKIPDGPGPSTRSNTKGKKRAASPTPEVRRKSKRRKKGAKVAVVVEDASAAEEEADDNVYPDVQLASTSGDSVGEKVPVLRYELDLRYTSGETAQKVGWKAEEEAFIQYLDSVRGSSSEPVTVDLGDIRLGMHKHRIVGSSELLRDVSDNPLWLLLLPTFDDDINYDDHDFSTSNCRDLFMTSSILNFGGKVAMDAHLSMVILPSDNGNSTSGDLPFQLQVEICTSLLLPQLFEQSSRRERKTKLLQEEDAQRRLLSYVYDTNKPQPESFRGSTNIPYFYSILGPAPVTLSPMAQEAMQPDALRPTLLPFQRRSVAWLLGREGMAVTEAGEIVPSDQPTSFSFWDTITEGNHTWYLNRLSGELTDEAPYRSDSLGAILAEEPGLGKTLEMITLMLVNPPPPERNPTVTNWDPKARLHVKEVKPSLIVTPPSLASQWVDEIAAHAPSLKVLVYDGWSKVPVPITRSAKEALRLSELKAKEDEAKGKKSKRKATKRKRKADDDMDVDEEVPEVIDLTKDEDGETLEWSTYVQQFDVVITTYQVLRTDLNVARAAPERPRREDVVYSIVERPRSPLVMVEWNRVIMDEVQMVGGGKTEDMVSLIPRRTSFAVSGTPSRAQVSDLVHVLKFLRIGDIIGSMKLWNRLQAPAFSGEFAAFFQTYAVRTMKSAIKDELTIPHQTRYLVPIELGPVERHMYDQAFEGVLLEIGLDYRGIAASSGWEVDGTLLRAAIRRLRAICTHPQVGRLQRKGDNIFKSGTLKTIEEVLENMIDLSWRNIMEDWRNKLVILVRHARLQQRDKGNRNCYQDGLQTLLRTEKEVDNHIAEIEQLISEHDEKGKILKQQAALARAEGAEAERSSSNNKGKGKEVDEASNKGDEEDEDGDLPRTPAGEEHKTKRRALQQRLREAKLILHQVKFLQGDVYHVLGESHTAAEDLAYASAETIRKGLLKVSMRDAQDAMTLLQNDVATKRVTKDELLIPVPFTEQGGIRSALLIEEVNTIIENVLNEQSELLWQWRTHIIELLTLKLDSGGNEVDGQEYQRSLDSQGEAETYIQVYATLLADRREALVNERTLLALHDAQEKKLRKTKAAFRAANALDLPDDLETLHVDDLEPEQAVMLNELSQERKDILKRLSGRAIKSILVDLNAAAARIANDKDPEKDLVKQAITGIRKLITSQNALHDKLDNDLAFIRKAFNQRILYFRQLQEISDAVTEVTWEGGLIAALQECVLQENELENGIRNKRARYRYLVNLTTKKDNDEGDGEEERMCILCRCDFSRGFLTQCGHVFCEGCMKAWLLRKEGKTCPICRVAINIENIHRFSIGADELSKPPQKPTTVDGEPIPRSSRQIAYNKIDPKLFAEIQEVDCFGDYGTKIQTLVRHVLHLQLTDPGAKSIIFSAWADSLYIVEHALRHNGVGCLRIDQNTKGNTATKRFRTDPNLRVLLLHGERENAGLNITCASRVFLLESVVHHSFEIQAIARIDRMGQTRPTEVFCYYAEETVEENILDLAARQGLSLYTKGNSAGTLNIYSLVDDNDKKAVDSPAKKAQKGDFIYRIDDMLAILFPHLFEEIDYLIPSGEDMDVSDAPPVSSPSRLANAIAEASARR